MKSRQFSSTARGFVESRDHEVEHGDLHWGRVSAAPVTDDDITASQAKFCAVI